MVRGLVGPTNTNTTHRPPIFQYEAMRHSAKPWQGGCVGHQEKKQKNRSNKYVVCIKNNNPKRKKINNAHQHTICKQFFRVITTTCCIYYCCTDSRSIFFPVENVGSSWTFWQLAIGERGQVEVKDEKENTPLVDMVAIVGEVYCAVCQLNLRLWNTTLAI